MSKSVYNLIVKFSGICAFVPSEEVHPDTGYVSAMDVLTVAANQDNLEELRRRFLPGTSMPSEHFTFLVFDLKNLPGVSMLPSANRPPLGTWHLLNEEISFLTGVPDTRVQLKRTGAKLPMPDPSSDDEPFDFLWVPILEDVYPGVGQVDELLVHPDDSVSKISACIHLSGGEISVSDLGAVEGGSPPLLRFLPCDDPQSHLDQVLASEIQWKVPVLQDEVVVSLRDFKDDHERSLVLRPQLDSNNMPQDIVISLVNLCPPSVFKYVGSLSGGAGVPEPDIDFMWLYLLPNELRLEGAPVLPVPIMFKNIVDGGVEPQICSGGVTRPPSPSVDRVQEKEQ